MEGLRNYERAHGTQRPLPRSELQSCRQSQYLPVCQQPGDTIASNLHHDHNQNVEYGSTSFSYHEATYPQRIDAKLFNPGVLPYNLSQDHRDNSKSESAADQQNTSDGLQRSLVTPPTHIDLTGGTISTRKKYALSRLGSGAGVGFAATNTMNNRCPQRIRNAGGLSAAQQRDSFSVIQTASYHPSMFSNQDEMSSKGYLSELVAESNRRIEKDQSNNMGELSERDQQIFHHVDPLVLADCQQQQQPCTQRGPSEWSGRSAPSRDAVNSRVDADSSNASADRYCELSRSNPHTSFSQLTLVDSQQQLDSYRVRPSAYAHSSFSRPGFERLREECKHSFQRNPNAPVHYLFASSRFENAPYGDKVDDELAGFASLFLTSNHKTRSSIRANHLGPMQPSHNVADSIALQNAYNGGPSNNSESALATRPSFTDYARDQHGRDRLEYNKRAQQVEKSLAAIIPQNIQQIAVAIQAELEQLVQGHEPGFLGQFRPSNSALKNVGLLENGWPQISPETYGCSKNYQGDVTVATNRSALIPDNKNCAVWVLGLPASTTHVELLGAIRNVGQIYACVINPPTEQYQTSAAKIVFFERYQAEAFMRFALGGQFSVLGQRIRHVRWNKIKSARYPNSSSSRSICITGPCHLMDFGFFEVFFLQRFTYELEGRREVPCATPGMTSHEWRFGSLRCQSASAKTAIQRELRDIFAVEWVRDPCM